jgi:hypothetical protein
VCTRKGDTIEPKNKTLCFSVNLLACGPQGEIDTIPVVGRGQVLQNILRSWLFFSAIVEVVHKAILKCNAVAIDLVAKLAGNVEKCGFGSHDAVEFSLVVQVE